AISTFYEVVNFHFKWREKMKTIYVGNIPYKSSLDDVRGLFESLGRVNSVKLIADRYTSKPRGFGFVEMDEAAADEAISKLNETVFDGRILRVSEALERAPRRSTH
ncbi:MAG: hypothetical protein KAI75_08560, partial [Desulfobulbaceae bacterium]|nr:hypothetical protein [Desulfobulbaceae bacterium]